MTHTGAMNASDWLARLEQGEDPRARSGDHAPGAGDAQAYVGLVRSVVGRFADEFGDRPLRLFRAPGRVNLRGMHVDTHGGWLNLMTHQREVVVAACAEPARGDGTCRFVNTAEGHAPCVVDWRRGAGLPAFEGDWRDFITSPEVRDGLLLGQSGWERYLAGTLLRVRRGFPRTPLGGVWAAVGSNLPQGAALSSSAALVLAVMRAVLGVNGLSMGPWETVLAAQDAEWYTGARVGLGDQSAIVFGRAGQVARLAIHGRQSAPLPSYFPWPVGLRLLVVNSHSERSLSGNQLVAYTKNRFAYSMALEILRQEMIRGVQGAGGVPAGMQLSSLSPNMLGGQRALYHLLERIPEEIELDALQQRYDLPGFEASYRQYFGGVAESERPSSIALRGPLLFGMAESARAGKFCGALSRGDVREAGRLMNVGHDGDRVVDRAGQPFAPDAGDEYLRECARNNTPIESCPGVYGASSPLLDYLVDTALDRGALGACLTGAGIAGSILALCREEDCTAVTQGIEEAMASGIFRQRGGPVLSPGQRHDAVVPNEAPAGAGELLP